MIPRGFVSVITRDSLWVAAYRVGTVWCYCAGTTITEAVDGLLRWIDENLVAILQTDAETPKALRTVN